MYKRMPRLAFGLALLFLLVWYVKPIALASKLIGLDFEHLVFAAIFIVAATLLGACNAYMLVDSEARLGILIFTPLYWLSWAVGLVFPGQVGDIVTLSVLMKRRGVDVIRTLGRSMVDKLISFLIVISFACSGLYLMPRIDYFGIAVVVSVAVIVMFLAYLLRAGLLQIFLRVVPGLATGMRQLLEEVISLTRRNPERIGLNVMFTVVKVVLVGCAYWNVFLAAGYDDIGLWPVITLAAVTSIVAYLPISFNGIGTVEASGIVLFAVLGVSEADVLAVLLTLRLMVLFLAWIPAGLWLVLGRNSHD